MNPQMSAYAENLAKSSEQSDDKGINANEKRISPEYIGEKVRRIWYPSMNISQILLSYLNK